MKQINIFSKRKECKADRSILQNGMENLALEKPTPKKIKPIARKRHNYIYLLIVILFGIITIYIIKTFPPTYKIPIQSVELPILPLFFISLVGFIFSALTFIFIKKTQGIIVSIFVVTYLILRLIGLTHWIFLILVIALFITTELFIFRKK